jgi:hypothetical protein
MDRYKEWITEVWHGMCSTMIVGSNMTDTIIAKQIRLEQHSPSYWRVTFGHPSLNIFGPQNIPQLNEIITALETDEHVKVVVFDSAVEGFFLTHYSASGPGDESPSRPSC